MHREFFPGPAAHPTESTALRLRRFRILLMARFHNRPHARDLRLARSCSLPLSHRLDLRLRHLMFPYQMLHKVVLPIARVRTIRLIASPPLQMPMPLILMPHPVGFAFEAFGLGALGEGAGERLHVFVHVFRPVGGFGEFFGFEADRAFEGGGEVGGGWGGDVGRELGRGDEVVGGGVWEVGRVTWWEGEKV